MEKEVYPMEKNEACAWNETILDIGVQEMRDDRRLVYDTIECVGASREKETICELLTLLFELKFDDLRQAHMHTGGLACLHVLDPPVPNTVSARGRGHEGKGRKLV